MQPRSYRTALCALLLVVPAFTAATAQQPRANRPVSAIPVNVLLPIMRAEDQRRWDNALSALLHHKEAQVRKRAALALGRIGDERAVAALIEALQTESDNDVRQMIAFAIGEIESTVAADALIQAARADQIPYVRARALEALGKIAAALPTADEARRQAIGQVILDALITERKAPVTASGVANLEVELLGLTAALRARPKDAGKVLALYLSSVDWRVRADALNALARLRLKDGNDEARKMVVDHSNPIVRANAARVLGATEDKQAFDALLDRALHDDDLRVRVSAIRALGSLKDKRAAASLLERGEQLLAQARQGGANDLRLASQVNEIFEIATSIGRVLPNSNDGRGISWLRKLRSEFALASPEVEIAFARIAPQAYQMESIGSTTRALFSDPNASRQETTKAGEDWHGWANLGQGLGELASIKTGNPILDTSLRDESSSLIHRFLTCPPRLASEPKFKPRAGDVVSVRCTPLQTMAVPDFLRAYAALKPQDLSEELRKNLNAEDVIVRATAAELLSEQPLAETNTRALIQALPRALRDKDLNDAALAILDALAKQKSKEANEAIKTALDSSDHLIRRRAVALLKANGVGDFSNLIGTVKTRNTEADYRRAIARIGKHVTTTLLTSKGSFVIEFLPEDAPLTVDNFVQLARKGYFNGITFHRVVPNFVIQGGDPRGDGSGGPGYSIRCEINEVPFDRAAVGMALSGKDTGGSQWFVTHAPQPHLDGGYTVFGRVIRGMEVVDRIARGDTIRRVIVNER